jgi:hypothetical protein
VILAKELDPTQVSPGVIGFIVTFALALVCWLLFRSLTTHLRRVSHSPEPTEPGGAVDDVDAEPVEDAASLVEDAASPVDVATTEPASRTRGAARPKP